MAVLNVLMAERSSDLFFRLIAFLRKLVLHCLTADLCSAILDLLIGMECVYYGISPRKSIGPDQTRRRYSLSTL